MNETEHLVFEVTKELQIGDLVHITLNPDGTTESPELIEHKAIEPEIKEDVQEN